MPDKLVVVEVLAVCLSQRSAETYITSFSSSDGSQFNYETPY